MSDDSFELGGFGPTTPAHSSIKPQTTRQRGSTRQTTKIMDPGPSKRSTRNVASSSSRPAKRKKAEAEQIVVESEDDEPVEVDGREGEASDDGSVQKVDVVASSDEDEVRAEVEKQLNGNGAKTRGRVNGHTQQKRGKPSSSSLKQPQKSSKKVVEVQASDAEENADADVIHIDVPPPPRESRTGKGVEKEKAVGGRASRQPPPKRRKEDSAMDVDEALEGQDGMVALIDKIGATNGRAPPATGGASSSGKDAQLVRLKEKVSWLENENKALSNQLEELFRVRETEAEALMKRSEEQYESKIRALEELNQALTEQLVKKQPLAGMGRSSVLNFITREAADAEKQTLDREITKLKAELDDAMKNLKLKDEEIEERKQIERDLRFDLNAEIERAKSLAKQAPRHQLTPRSGMVAEDPKHREAIKLYEDLTNIIVLNIRSSPGAHGRKDEWQFNCYYTHTNELEPDNPTTRSLSFTFRSFEQLDRGEWSDWVQYLPMSLETETEDFRRRLNFLNAPFQFERNQLALFLRTLYTTVEEIVKGGDENEDEVQELPPPSYSNLSTRHD